MSTATIILFAALFVIDVILMIQIALLFDSVNLIREDVSRRLRELPNTGVIRDFDNHNTRINSLEASRVKLRQRIDDLEAAKGGDA